LNLGTVRRNVGDLMFAEKAPYPGSPKSMYALADAYRLDDLRTEALKMIKFMLTPQNVLLEVFSHFSGKYEVVCDMEVKYLLEHWNEVKQSAVWMSVLANKWIITDTPNHKRAWAQISAKLSSA